MDKESAPPFRKGDIIAVTNDLSRPGVSVYHGLHVFEAKYEPELRGQDWYYGYQPCSEIRMATAADIAKLIHLSLQTVQRAAAVIERLNGLKALLPEIAECNQKQQDCGR